MLMDLIKQGLKASLKQGCPWHWQFDTFQFPGYYALQFEQYALLVQRRGEYPDAAVIGVNMRSLNRLGDIGFFKLPAGGLFYQPGKDATPIQSLYRGLTAWTRDMMVSTLAVDPRPSALIAPPSSGSDAASPISVVPEREPLPGATPPNPARHAANGDKGSYPSVYGEGYALDPATERALLHTGEILRAGGTVVLYYLTPVDLKDLQIHCGSATLAAVESSSALVVGRLKGDGFPVLDEHALLNDGFIAPPTEHLDANGRIRLAQALVPWINAALLPGDTGIRRR
jgi:hypothetical protein